MLLSMRNSNKPVFISILSLLFLVAAIDVISAQNFVPTDRIFLNCGGPPNSTDDDNRNWTSDIGSAFALSSSGSTTAPATVQRPGVPQVPYMTARIFQSDFTYSFPVAPGRKFVRLYFYPAPYNNLNASDGVFAVTSGSFTLLRNFSVAQTASALNFDYIMREFSINVASGTLNVTFSPSRNQSNSFAFVNGIEIVSHPDIYRTDNTVTVVGQSIGFTIDNSTALENVYRLNVGGNAIPPSRDTGIFRSWENDVNYIFSAFQGVTYSNDANVTVAFPSGSPSYIAPLDMYSTRRSMSPNFTINQNTNLTWIFTVDTGFNYLVRVHLCELWFNINRINQIQFSVFLNNQTAQNIVDVIALGGSTGATRNGIPVHRDYILLLPRGPPRQDLRLDLHPYIDSNVGSRSQFYNAFLNGLEIFKVSDSSRNLAGPNPDPLPPPQVDSPPGSSSGSGQSNGAMIGGVVGGVIAFVVLAGLLVFFVRRRQKLKKDPNASDGWLPLSLYGFSHSSTSGKTNTTGSHASTLPANICRHFSFNEIKAATNNFDEALILGVGGFGKVYRGEIDNGTKVAIKRGNALSGQGVHEFQTEIELLSKLRHRHLVSLIGFSEEKGEMILVYDYMAYGTLREHLYKTQNPPLSWKRRLEICIGAARGLHYLHTGAKHTIIHRDVKSTNILLDEKWDAKVADFGLSKTGPMLDNTHVSTMVKGSFGYLDPEYFRRQQLTEKSDVYSFGVVLFEIICARPALNPALPKEQVSLAEWGQHCYKKGILDQVTDPYLKGKIAPECYAKFVETAVKCVEDYGTDRPSMGDVLWSLEFALQLQESAEENNKGEYGGKDKDMISFTPDMSPGYDSNITDSKSSGMSMSIGGQSLASVDSDGLTPSAVFSQIMNPKGR